MTTKPHATCPVCWQSVTQTKWGHIAAHRDSLNHDWCPATHEPFDITNRTDDPMKVA